MMKIAVLAALAGSVVAFAPSQQAHTSTALGAAKVTEAQAAFFDITVVDFTKEVGSLPPLGFFDPLGLLSEGTQETFDDLREKELKHGRVSMLATLGYLTTAAGVRFPGAEGTPDGLRAFGSLLESKDGMQVLGQMVAFFVVAEIVNRDADWVDNTPEFVGDYRNGVLDFGWDKLSDKAKLNKRTIELNNGRAAMMGIFGLVVHEIMGESILPGGYLPGQ